MTAPGARYTSPHADEIVHLNGGDNPQQRRPRRFNPDWDPAGLWSIPAAGTDTCATDRVDDPENQRKFV